METVGIAVLAMIYVASWIIASRRRVALRERQSREWTDSSQRPDLWTSEATCIHCGAAGGLLELKGGDTHFTCLACGKSHVRQTRA